MSVGPGPNPPWAWLSFDTGCTVQWTEPQNYPNPDIAPPEVRTVTIRAANGTVVVVDQRTGTVNLGKG